MTSMLDFYRKHGISPVHQDISDLPAHFARRAALYRALGLPPIAFQDKSVLEVGPGSGQNALYIRSLGPDEHFLVEPNHAGVLACRGLGFSVAACSIEECTFLSSDIVLCEGVLGLAGGDASDILEACAKHVDVGGVLVITCIDAISDHSEVVRRAMANRLVNDSMSIAEQLDILRPVFTPHLATLKGMTRSVDDWIIDNLLNPASIGPTFSIPDACAQLEGRFTVLGCSPRFLMDWRWYKESDSSNQWAIDSYWQQAHNLLDYRVVEPARDEADNRRLMTECEQTRIDVRNGQVPTQAHRYAEPSWFGRGQQYLSFVRL